LRAHAARGLKNAQRSGFSGEKDAGNLTPNLTWFAYRRHISAAHHSGIIKANNMAPTPSHAHNSCSRAFHIHQRWRQINIAQRGPATWWHHM